MGMRFLLARLAGGNGHHLHNRRLTAMLYG
jgi:hypothetical protein